MASQSERLRWEMWHARVTDRMERQKKSITRLVFLLTEGRAALLEIAAMDGRAGGSLPKARKRAQQAIERMDAAAAEIPQAEALVAEAQPEDPRRKY